MKARHRSLKKGAHDSEEMSMLADIAAPLPEPKKEKPKNVKVKKEKKPAQVDLTQIDQKSLASVL